MASTITEEDKKFVETWENVGPAVSGILRLDARGDIRHEMIQGKRTFMITTEERMFTQDRINVRELDPFMNGTFRPVIVPDSVTVESNPNALSEEEIKKILASSDVAWEEWLKTIDSVATVRRMIEIAESTDLSLKRYRQLEQRLVEVRPLSRIESNDPELQKFLDPGKRDAGENRQRQRGGMSGNYR